MLPIFKKNLKSLQNLCGSIANADNNREESMYWLMSAIIKVSINRSNSPDEGVYQNVAYALSRLNCDKEKALAMINQHWRD